MLRIEAGRRAFLFSWNWLAQESILQRKHRWHVVPKMHYWDHIWRQVRIDRFNPCRAWCFLDEDVVGVMSRIAKAIGNWKVQGIMQRYALLLAKEITDG